jgi:Flp pilus assembly protein TadB
MHHQLLTAATLIAATANSGKTFHIGPWIVVPILILIAIIGTPTYVIRDRRKRRAEQRTR